MIKSNYIFYTEALDVGYADYQLLKEINIKITAGDCLSIYGDNGIGKSSLLRTLAGLQQQIGGTVHWVEEPFYLTTAKPFHTELSVYENLRFWQTILNNENIKLGSVIEQFYLEPLLSTPFNYLSEGQKQRLNLCLLKLSPKKLWLVDEPFISLDEKSKEIAYDLFAHHLTFGGSIIFAQPVYAAIATAELNLNYYKFKIL